MSFHLRALPAALAAVAYAAGLLWVSSLQDFAWLGDSLWGQESLALASVIALPILLAVTALDGAQDRRQLFPLITTRQRLRHVLLILTARALPALAALLVSHGMVFVASQAEELTFDNASLWPVLTQTCGVILAIATSYAVGVLLASWPAAAVAPGLWLGALFADRTNWLPTGIVEFSPAGTLLGYTPDIRQFVVRAAWMLALAAGFVALTLANRKRGRDVIAGAIAALFIAGLALNGNRDGYVYSAEVSDVCVGGAPELCGPRELESRLRFFEPFVKRAVNNIHALGVDTPPKYEAWTAEKDASHEPWLLMINPGRPREFVTTSAILGQVVAPRSCQIWRSSTPPPDEWFTAEALVSGWVAVQLGEQPSGLYATFSARVPENMQTPILARASMALQTCEPATLPPEEAMRL